MCKDKEDMGVAVYVVQRLLGGMKRVAFLEQWWALI
jgi:hypothetical protein